MSQVPKKAIKILARNLGVYSDAVSFNKRNGYWDDHKVTIRLEKDYEYDGEYVEQDLLCNYIILTDDEAYEYATDIAGDYYLDEFTPEFIKRIVESVHSFETDLFYEAINQWIDKSIEDAQEYEDIEGRCGDYSDLLDAYYIDKDSYEDYYYNEQCEKDLRNEMLSYANHVGALKFLYDEAEYTPHELLKRLIDNGLDYAYVEECIVDELGLDEIIGESMELYDDYKAYLESSRYERG